MTRLRKSAETILLLLIFIIIAGISSFNVCAEANNSEYLKNCGVYDDFGILSENELQELDELIKSTSEKIDMYVAVYLSEINLTDPDTITYSENRYEEFFGENTDGLFFYMDLSGKQPAYDYISTSGMAALVYTDENNDGTDNRIDKMFDNIYTYLPSSGETVYASDIKQGIEEFCRQLEKYADKGVKSGYYCYDSIDDKYIYEKNGKAVVSEHKPMAAMLNFLPQGIGIGIIAGVIIFFIIKSTYRFKKGVNSSVYVSQDETNFTFSEDRFIRQYVTKTKIESSSSSGGSHHSGGSHGGGSHGGGGSHR